MRSAAITASWPVGNMIEQKQKLADELAALAGRRGPRSERRVALLKSNSIDPDILDEKSREMLGLTHPNEVVVFLPR